MRRFLSTSFIILALAVSAAGATPAAHAATCPAGQFADSATVCWPSQAQADAATASYGATNELTPAEQAASNAAATADAKTPTNPDLGAGTAQFGTVMTWIMKLFAWLVGVAALTLDYAVYYTVVTMGTYVHNLTAIGVAWQILRDIGNIMLIFGFLAVGITTILNVDWYGSGTKMLPMMFVAAIFLNFSLFISEAIIDTGNLFATQFFTQINGGNLPTAGPSGLTAGGVALTTANEGISNRIMGQLGLQTIYGDAINNNLVLKAGNSWLIGFMGIILFLVTAFVMFSLAFVLIARFIILIFLILLAPVGFAGLAVPMLAKRAGQWWDKLFEQTVTAPILLLMLYIALAVITDVHFMTGFGSSSSPNGWTGYVANAAGLGNLPGFASLLLSFIVAMGLLMAVVIQSKNLSAFGADWASKTAGKLTFGATAFVGRRTVGRASNFAARSIRSSKFGRSDMGKLFAGVADKGAKASFDIRGATIAGGLAGIKGVEAGDAQKGGYRGREDELIKSRVEYAKSLRQTAAEREATDNASTAKRKEEGEYTDTMAHWERTETAQIVKSKDVIEARRTELGLETKQQALEEANRSGDTNRVKAAQTEYDLALKAFQLTKDEEQGKIDDIRKEIELEKNSHKTIIGVQQNIIDKNSPAAVQREYAAALKRKTIFGDKGKDNGIRREPYDWTTAVGSARSEAAKKITSEANKDPILKRLDEMDAKSSKAASESSGKGAH